MAGYSSSLCITHSPLISPNTPKLNIVSLPCVKTSNTSCPPPLLLLKSTLKRSWSDVCICECECVCECENICKCVAPAVKPRQRFKSPRADTQGWEAVSTTQPLAAEEVTLIMSCQCLEIRVSTAISYPACVCVCACICVCVCCECCECEIESGRESRGVTAVET